MTPNDDLIRRARAWLAEDPDPDTRAELERAIAAADPVDLSDRFAGPLVFGTAGLRGVIGAGDNRMNQLVVARATAGLVAHLEAAVPGSRERGIVIGYDGRRKSALFAREAAEIATARGFHVFAFETPAPTPLVAYTARVRNAAAGIVVTASHNPPEYNGYKVYWGNGAQIIPPVDEHIAASIAAIGPYATIAKRDLAAARAKGLYHVLGDDAREAYLGAIAALPLHPEAPRNGLRIAYTALHGVGNALALESMKRAGFTQVASVAAQAEPDGEFPTVAFPNPEEKGAMDLVLALAREQDAELVLANDPDADRLAVAVRTSKGTYTQLTGNDVGSLLGHYLLEQGASRARTRDKRLVLSSIVSSPMLGAIAQYHGVHAEQTLTGFKWIANRAMELEARDHLEFVFGYEEALGYTVSDVVRDKDGIGTALVVADMAAYCKSQGRTLLDELERACRLYGFFASRQVSVTKKGADGAAAIRGIMDKVRRNPPKSLGNCAIEAVADLERSTHTRADGTATPIPLPKSDAIALHLAGGHRVMLRPSGTEPKIKYYFDVRVTLREDESIADGRGRADTLLDELVTAFRAVVD